MICMVLCYVSCNFALMSFAPLATAELLGKRGPVLTMEEKEVQHRLQQQQKKLCWTLGWPRRRR